MTNIPVQWGRRVKRIEHDNDGVTIYFEDGGSAKGDILVGADGINSVGESLIHSTLRAVVVWDDLNERPKYESTSLAVPPLSSSTSFPSPLSSVNWNYRGKPSSASWPSATAGIC